MITKFSFSQFLKLLARQLVPNIGSIVIMAGMLFVYTVQAAGVRAPAAPTSPYTAPTVISYQGTLSNNLGEPVSGSIGLTFRFYNTLSGGTALWTEDHTGANAVPVSNGLFQVLLGSLVPIPGELWTNNPSVYLGVQVEGDSSELAPREVVSSVPYALQTANLVIPDDSVITSKILDGAVTTVKLADGAATNAKIAPSFFYGATSSAAAITTTASTVLSLPVTFSSASTYLIIVRLETTHDQGNARIATSLRDESATNFATVSTTHVILGAPGTQTTSFSKLVKMTTGAHTFRLDTSTLSGTGQVVSAEIYAIPFVQAP